MTTYKLHITYTFDEEDQAVAAQRAKSILRNINPEVDETSLMVALNRDGDKSAANLLASIPNSNNHYKHGKINITEVE